MTKRLNDTEALKSLGIKEAGAQLASDKSPYWGEAARLEPAYQSADYAVEAGKRAKEREARMNSPAPFDCAKTVSGESRRKTGAGNSSLSSAVKICKE